MKVMDQPGIAVALAEQKQTIHERFEQQAATTPDAVAVSFEGDRVTYRELNARANRLALRSALAFTSNARLKWL
jgi:non-ribosomal peptide synthetase component F